MGLTIQGGQSPSLAAYACKAKETKTTEVVIEDGGKVVYRTTEKKETTLSDTLLSAIDKVISIAAALAKIINLPIPTF